MTRLDRLLLHVPRLRSLVQERDAFAGHCARLQGELADSLERERALRNELEGPEASALLDHALRLKRELAENLEREQTLRKELEAARHEAAAFLDRCGRLQDELAVMLERERRGENALAGTLHARQEAGEPTPADPICKKMRDDWDGRVRSNGLSFIASGQPFRTEDDFFRSGEENVRDHILTDLENICRGKDPKQMRVVEIGCGAGRLTRALAAIFGEVHAVDISPEMIRQARQKLGGLANVHLYVNNGADLSMLPDGAFDFAFSFIVFQHIPDRAIIESYVRETHRVVEPGALFKFQVGGGPTGPTTVGAPYDTWHGVSFTEDDLRDLAQRCGFEPRYAKGAGTQYFWAWFFKR